ncbi:hypothetical protein MTR67_027567 [Solanum verrucosum]|uniref:Uncharacterized protein n=1 Tax=Solanum verrucosum TaxID=315347 RepID=A0AAF0R0X9_SOLVR|nr:hypothetical protein MTR67_027567 [Solanum verrucosum]
MEMNSHIRDTASQHSEDTLQVNKCMDLTQEVPNRSENAGKKRDHKRTELSKHAFYESHIDNAAQSTIIKEDYAMKVANVAKAADNASVHTDVFPAKYQHPVEQTISSAEEVFEMVAEKEISPTKFTSLINNHEQMKADTNKKFIIRLPRKVLKLNNESRIWRKLILEYEAVAVEEKTIRMEKNDYQVSKVPTLGLLKTGENDESSSEMDSKTSPKGSGRRQLKPSFFSIAPHQHQFIK